MTESRSPEIASSAEQPSGNAAVEPTRKDGWPGERDLVKGIDANIIGRIMLAGIARMLFGGAVILGVFCLGFWMGRGF